MKTAVITITCGEFYTKMSLITHPVIKAYADKIGADFIVLDTNDEFELPHYLKLNLNKYLREYDRVLYIDTDILIRQDAPNIFEEVPEDCIGIFEEGQFMERAEGMNQFLTNSQVDPKIWNKKYYNTGVMVLSREHANVFIKPIREEIDHFKEQSYLNLLFCLFKPKIHNLHYKWNRMYALDQITGEERFNSYFMHYAGINCIMPEEAQLKIMQEDLDKWNSEHPEYKYQKNVAIMVEGGLGDQLCAEPSIRYMRDILYKGDNIIVVSDFPYAFKHLGLKVYAKGEKIDNMKGYYIIHTLRSPEHVSWEYMSHPLCHSVDFSALQTMRRLLPTSMKTMKLPVDFSSIASVFEMVGGFDNSVIIHPGRGWESKTFPADIWEGYIKTLTDADFKVIVVGKRISKEQGVVEINTNFPNCINLIDKLSFDELTALISQVPVLISNDSAPIHIAGSFNNWIGVIATCKHPDYILPYRKGSVYHKAKALESYDLYDQMPSQPNLVYGATIDVATEEQIRKCCPSNEKILNFVWESMRN